MRITDLSLSARKQLYEKLGLEPKKKPTVKSKSTVDTENLFASQCRAHKLPMFKRQYKFAADIGRGWMFDFCWVEYKAALECEGLVVKRVNGELLVTGRHVHPAGFRGDSIKYGMAAIMGWGVLRFEQTHVKDGTAIDMAMELLKARGWRP
jgi:hypothetical protein